MSQEDRDKMLDDLGEAFGAFVAKTVGVIVFLTIMFTYFISKIFS